MVKITGTTITMTRGDTLKVDIGITDSEGNTYTPQSGDTIRFAMKKSFSDSSALLEKTIPTDTLLLTLDSDDTKPFAFGTYVYDIELTYASGDVDTFIPKGTIKLSEEVE